MEDAMGWTCDPDFADVLDTPLETTDWAYVALIDRSDLGNGDVQLGRYPGPDEAVDDAPAERKERALAWLRGRVNQRIAIADRRSILKLRVRAYGIKGLSNAWSHTFTVRFEGEPAVDGNPTPLASEARELVTVMLDGVRGIVTTAGSLMSQMGNQLLDERRQLATLQTRLAEKASTDQERQSRTAVANRFLDTLDGAVKVVAGEVHPVLANPKVRALLDKPEVQAALKDEGQLDQLLEAVTYMAQSRQAFLAPKNVPPPPPPASAAVRALESELSKDANLAVLLNTAEGTDALVTTLRHLAAQTQEESDEPVPA